VEVQGGGKDRNKPSDNRRGWNNILANHSARAIEHLSGLSAVFTDHCKYYLYAINPDGSLKWRREQGKYELIGVE